MNTEKNLMRMIPYYTDRPKSWSDIDNALNGIVTLLTFSILYLNDEVYDYQMRLKEVFPNSVYCRFKGKYLYNRINEGVRRYNRLIRDVVGTKMENYASILVDIDEMHQKHISNYYYAVSKCLLENGIDGNLNTIESLLSVMDMLCQASKMSIDAFQRNVSSKFGVYNPTRKLDISMIDRPVLELSNIIMPKGKMINLNENENIVEAFHVFTNKLLSLETIKAVMEDD